MKLEAAKKIVLDNYPDAYCERGTKQVNSRIFEYKRSYRIIGMGKGADKAWISAATQILNEQKDKV